MRILLVMVFACGSSKPKAESPGPAAVVDPCKASYGEFEDRWRTARSEELREIGFDQEAIDEVVSIEVALLPNTEDVEKLRTQYTAISVFLPDAPWPRALDAAEAAIAVCGEEAPRP